ncbi:MAG: IS3 family transposase [Syntrophomonadaceae bacterium]|nr:IS3 family transposase [Syntrophomonadaceae bacterium]
MKLNGLAPVHCQTECYSRHDFQSFMEAYAEVARYIEYYNRKRRHDSLRYMSPEEFHQAFMSKLMKVESFAV